MKTNLFTFSILLISTVVFGQEIKVKEKRQIAEPNAIPISEIKLEEEVDVEVPISIVEEPPRFEACKALNAKEARDCFFTELNNHIKKNLNYPKDALDSKIEGRVLIMFVINSNGNVQDIKTKGIKLAGTQFLEEESIRIIKLLPKLIPAKQRTKPVSVSVIVPVMFKL